MARRFVLASLAVVAVLLSSFPHGVALEAQTPASAPAAAQDAAPAAIAASNDVDVVTVPSNEPLPVPSKSLFVPGVTPIDPPGPPAPPPKPGDAFKIVDADGNPIVGTIEVPAGTMLDLGIKGVSTPFDDPEKPKVPKIGWVVYPQTDQHRVHDRGFTFTQTNPHEASYVIVATRNSDDPLEAPYRYAIIAKFVGAPKPTPPGPGPGPGPGPTPPPGPVVEGQRLVVIIYESDDSTPAFNRLLNGLLVAGPNSKYLADKKHELHEIDKQDTSYDGTSSELLKKYGPSAKFDRTLIVADKATGAVIAVGELTEESTASGVIEFIRQNGG